MRAQQGRLTVGQAQDDLWRAVEAGDQVGSDLIVACGAAEHPCAQRSVSSMHTHAGSRGAADANKAARAAAGRWQQAAREGGVQGMQGARKTEEGLAGLAAMKGTHP